MTKSKKVAEFALGHITLRTTVCPRGGTTFALFAGEALTEAHRRKPLFTGHVEAGMGTQCRRLGHHLDDLEQAIACAREKGSQK